MLPVLAFPAAELWVKFGRSFQLIRLERSCEIQHSVTVSRILLQTTCLVPDNGKKTGKQAQQRVLACLGTESGPIGVNVMHKTLLQGATTV